MSSELAATIWVGIGGGLGGVARYSIERLMVRLAGAAAWGTLVVNVLGSFLIGYFGEPILTDASFGTAPDLRFLVAIGVFGGFTTFASFSLQAVELLRDGKIVRAMFYTLGSVALCLAATAVGIYAAGLNLATLA
jgi:CrcB protein